MMNTTSLTRTALLASGILAFFAVGCGGGGSSDAETDTIQEAPAETNEVINPEDLAARVDNFFITINGDRVVYETEFALNEKEMPEWQFRGWDLIEESLQNRSESVGYLPLEICLRDSQAEIVYKKGLEECGNDLHTHEVVLPRMRNLKYFVLVVGRDMVALDLQEALGEKELLTGKYEVGIHFDCWKDAYVSSENEKSLEVASW